MGLTTYSKYNLWKVQTSIGLSFYSQLHSDPKRSWMHREVIRRLNHCVYPARQSQLPGFNQAQKEVASEIHDELQERFEARDYIKFSRIEVSVKVGMYLFTIKNEVTDKTPKAWLLVENNRLLREYLNHQSLLRSSHEPVSRSTSTATSCAVSSES